jgi:hypothetical protein
MAIFEIKTNLPISTQLEIDKIEAKATTARTAEEAAFLVALAPYLTNEILQEDSDGLILEARGLTIPTGYAGFAKGATFIKYDNATKSIYENTGSTTVAAWNLLGEVDATDIANGSITNAKLANPLTLAGITLFADTAPINAVAASKVLTSDNTEVADGDTVTIGSIVYRFKDTPAQAYDVKRHGTTADTTMGNLIKAINASGIGDGTDYFAGTLIHPTVSAGTLTDHAFTATNKIKGVIGNSTAIAENSTHLSWAAGATALSGGINGTVGVKNEIRLDATNLYCCTAANTIADANWKKLVLQSL